MVGILEERVAQGTKQGLEFLEKIEGTPLTTPEVFRLLRHGLKDSIYAFLISDVRMLADQSGLGLNRNYGYPDVISALSNIVPEPRAIRIAGCYMLSTYNLSTPEEKDLIKDGLFKDLVNGVPYAGNLLVNIITFENKRNIHNNSD